MNDLSLPISVDDLLGEGSIEWERLEYKQGWNPEPIMHTICAFANDFHNLGGGYIIVGVEDNRGRPVLPPHGIDPGEMEKIVNELTNYCHTALKPNYIPICAPYQVEGKLVLAIWVPGGEERPYRAKRSLSRRSDDWVHYIRRNSNTVRANEQEERELISIAPKVPFDDRRNQTASLNDLSQTLMIEYLREVGSDLTKQAVRLPLLELAARMNIVSGPNEALFPKNVGLLFFNREPERFFPCTQIDVAYFPQGRGGGAFEERIFKGPLHRITQDALDFIKTNYLKELVRKSPEKAEADRFWNYPFAAIEEAVVNAVYHRSYEIREPIEIQITPEEITILNHPGPDRSIKMEDFRSGKAVARRYRNRRIGEFLKELDLTEGRSTGIPTILNAMKENGSPEPVFESDEERTSLLIRIPVHPLALGLETSLDEKRGVKRGTKLEGTKSKGTKSGTKSADGERAQSKGPVRGPSQGAQSEGPSDERQGTKSGTKSEGTKSGTKSNLSDDQRFVLTKMNQPQFLKDLLKVSGRSDRTKFRRTVIEPLIEWGLIERTIPEKPTSRLQQYRLTPLGRQYLENQQ